MIRSRQGTIAIDALFPETVGIVNMTRLNANIAKVFGRSGAEEIPSRHQREIMDIQKSGTPMVLARLDDESGLHLGREPGFTMFQGFFIDKLARNRDEIQGMAITYPPSRRLFRPIYGCRRTRGPITGKLSHPRPESRT